MPGQFPDSTLQVTPGTTASFVTERLKGTLYLVSPRSDSSGDVQGRRDAYVVSDHKQLSVANRWALTLKNDASSTFVEVTRVAVSVGTTVALAGTNQAGNRWNYLMLFRMSAISGGSLSTAVRLDTSSPDLSTQSRIKARRGSAGTTAGMVQMNFHANKENNGHGKKFHVFYDWGKKEPILLRQGEGIGLQWSPVVSNGTCVSGVHMYFRTRYQ